MIPLKAGRKGEIRNYSAYLRAKSNTKNWKKA
jgi:hypothetical protein